MNELGKKFLEGFQKNEAMQKELLDATRENLISIGKKYGYDLTPEDLLKTDEGLSLEELEAVAGGKGGCGCFLLGGGGGGGSVCVCVLGGGSSAGGRSCVCDIAGMSF